jgi:hypothetical protein
MKKHGGGVPLLSKGDRSRVTLLLKCFNAMATTEEKTVLMDKTTAEEKANEIVQHLHDLVCSLLRAAFISKGMPVPTSLTAVNIKKGILAGSIESRMKTLKAGPAGGCDVSTLFLHSCAKFREEQGPRLLRIREIVKEVAAPHASRKRKP